MLSVVHSRIEELTAEGQVPNVAEAGEERIRKADGLGANLIGELKVRKEEKPVLLDRTTKVDSHIATREEGVYQPVTQFGIVVDGIERTRIVGTPQRWIGRNVVIAEEEESAAMKFIAAGRETMFTAPTKCSRREIEIEGRDLELLDRLLREILRRAARDAVIDVRAVNRNASQCAGAACDRTRK